MQIVDNFFVKRCFWGKNRQKLTEKRTKREQKRQKFCLKILFLTAKPQKISPPPFFYLLLRSAIFLIKTNPAGAGLCSVVQGTDCKSARVKALIKFIY
jgi:hypothetical protein